MSYPNLELRALTDAIALMALDRGWRSHDVVMALERSVDPLREKERRQAASSLAGRLTRSEAESRLSHAMSEFWDDTMMEQFFQALAVRFPKRAKGIARIDEAARDASNARHRGEDQTYERLFTRAFVALGKLPW